jgi:hypothetical protein
LTKDYQLKIDETTANLAAEGNLRFLKQTSICARYLSDANVKSAGGNIEAPRSDWVALLVITTDTTTCTKPYDNKTTIQTSFSCKARGESQVRVLQQQQKRLPSEISYCSKIKASDKQTTLRLPISKSKSLLDSANLNLTYITAILTGSF